MSSLRVTMLSNCGYAKQRERILYLGALAFVSGGWDIMGSFSCKAFESLLNYLGQMCPCASWARIELESYPITC